MTVFLAVVNLATLLLLVACFPGLRSHTEGRRALLVFCAIILANLLGWIVL